MLLVQNKVMDVKVWSVSQLYKLPRKAKMLTGCLGGVLLLYLARGCFVLVWRQAVACANLRYLHFKFLTGFIYHDIFFSGALKFRLVFLYGRQLFFIDLLSDVRPIIWWLVVLKWLFCQTLYLYNWMVMLSWKFLIALVICY